MLAAWSDGVSDEPITMVRKLLTEFAAWSERPGSRGSGFTHSAMEFAASPGHPARRTARCHKASVEAWLAQQFARHLVCVAQSLATQIMLLVEECNALILIHNDRRDAKVATEAACMLVRAATKKKKGNSVLPLRGRRAV